MIDQAIKKINHEITEIKEPYGERLGTYIITDLLDSESNAGKILDAKKTLKDAYSAIKGNAHKQAVGGMAMIDDAVVFGWLREYYGITGAAGAAAAAEKAAEPAIAAPGKIVDLSSFL